MVSSVLCETRRGARDRAGGDKVGDMADGGDSSRCRALITLIHHPCPIQHPGRSVVHRFPMRYRFFVAQQLYISLILVFCFVVVCL